LLNQRVTAFSRLNQALAELMVNLQLLFNQRVGLNTGRLVWRNGLLRGFSVSVRRLLFTASCNS
jgi:hypothetical protein